MYVDHVYCGLFDHYDYYEVGKDSVAGKKSVTLLCVLYTNNFFRASRASAEKPPSTRKRPTKSPAAYPKSAVRRRLA